MKTKKYLLIIAFAVFVCVSGFRIAEDPLFLKNLKESLKQYNENFPEEKVYVQLDKPFYKPGEDVWFNVFVLNSNTHKPTLVSDVVYVELIDPKGNVASKLDLVVREGTAHGDFALISSAPGGMYQIRAYTSWMKNFGDDNFFKKDIQVQRIITPRFLLKLDYAKESYGSRDQVTARLSIRDLKDEKVTDALIDYVVKIEGRQVAASKSQSDAGGEANIVFDLPDSLTSTDGLLQVVVRARGIEESITRSIPIVLNRISMQFLPEGGNWVENVKSKMSFKALNEFGKGADVTGSIVDESNKVVARFESFHMGMGAFRLKPISGANYFARIESPAGNHSLIPLPSPSISDLVLNADAANDTTVTWSIYSPAKAYVNLVGRSHGEMVYAEQLKVNQGENQFIIPTKNFPVGIVVFTLFDFEGNERCERLIFANGSKGLKIQVTPNKKRYLPREEVQLDIKSVDDEGKPIASKLSIAVVDDQLITYADDKQDNILSSLLLSTELKGEIQEPSFYFDANEAKAKQALDYLLMTQGWRRFTWKDVYDNNRAIVYSGEKNSNLNGSLQNAEGAGIDGEVVLLEVSGRKRLVKLKTTNDGLFAFKNIDPTVPLMLLTKKPGKIVLRKEAPFAVSLNDKEGTMLLPSTVGEQNANLLVGETIIKNEVSDESGFNVSMDSDVSQLSEVIVTAFGAQEKRDLTGSVTVVHNNADGLFASTSPENMLQGRVSGLMIQPQTGNPASQANITMRGLSSLGNGRNEPLYVIDGRVIGTSLNQNFSNGSMLGPDEIESITVLNSPEASALYGCRSANGVILITTRTGIGSHMYQTRNKAPKFSTASVTPRKYSPTREFYAGPPSKYKEEIRKDFRTTIFWKHSVVTDKDGRAKVTFYNNDKVSAFRITAEGFSESGLIGRKEEVYYTELPLSLDVKLPQYLGYEDVLKVPVNVRNESSSTLSAKVSLSVPSQLKVSESLDQNVSIRPGTSETVWYTITSKGIQGDFPISIKLESRDHADQINQMITVRPVGFPVRLSFSGKELDKTMSFSINDAERNTMKANVTAFPDVLSDLFTGAESILREPHGCFEQVSSSTFPNILVLQFLKQSGLVNAASEKRALSLIKDGYSKLVAYEVKGGGFEWFGHPPAHLGLTAYGLVEFHEMDKVFPRVDGQMMNRTRAWLLNQRNGKGGFQRQMPGMDGFSRPDNNVTNAYITYALSETGTKDIGVEYNHTFDEVRRSKDMYRMALLANTAFNLGKMNDYDDLVKAFSDKVAATGFSNLKAEYSIVWSDGKSLETEVISLWTVALLKSSSPDLTLVDKCIKEILSRRSYGQFGSTQATTLALKALTEYARIVRRTPESGEIQIFVDNKLVDKHAYEKDARGQLQLTAFAKHLTDGDQKLRINFDGTKEPLPYSLDVQWYTKKPQSNDRCKVSLTATLSSASVRMNESVRLTAILKNKTNEELPMTLAVIGIPAGLSVQPWQLKELQEKKVFDFYEIMGGNLVIYYRGMEPSSQHTVNLDLKAEIPGSYVGGASSAYLYYTNEYKHWVSGNSVVIQ
ncbi:MAG TPA: TonB-dependent receptor plug domain-containing protein [Chryseolinea sp.]